MEEFKTEDNEVHCQHCDWWVPEGMEYLAEEHDCPNTDEMTTLEQEVIESRMEDIETAETHSIDELLERMDEEFDTNYSDNKDL